MKRKGTKRYQDLVTKYTEARYLYELRQKDIDRHEKELAEDEDNMTILTAVMKEPEWDDLKDWVKGLVECKTGMVKTLIGMEKWSQHNYETDMEKYGSILVSDYGDNLDELYRGAYP